MARFLYNTGLPTRSFQLKVMTTELDKKTLRRRIVELQVEHRDLDQIINTLIAQPGYDQLQIRRMKKRKLQIKDSIILLQMQLEPDILA